MHSARIVSRAFSVSRVIILLLMCGLVAAVSMIGQTSSKTSPAKKKAIAKSSSNRSSGKSVKMSLSKSSAHARGAFRHDEPSNGGRVNSKVVVTRKLVHGHWVRTTQIVHAEPGPTYQTHPDTERYQQIQQALAQKGYFKGEANGQWNDDSVAALKQFQTEQKINNDGKISSLSLIGLGLGPNRETTSAKADSPERE